jgi:hypothetical protein
MSRTPTNEASDHERGDSHVQLPVEPHVESLTVRRPSLPDPQRPSPPPRVQTRATNGRRAKVPPAPVTPEPTHAPSSLDLSAVQRQRLAQMQTQLDEARSTIARQRNEIDELRARIDAGDARLGRLVATVRDDARTAAIERRLLAVERPPNVAAVETSPVVHGRSREELAQDAARADGHKRTLEVDDLEARMGMEVRRAADRTDEIERRLAGMEAVQSAVLEALAAIREAEGRHDARLARIERLFEELAEGMRERPRRG